MGFFKWRGREQAADPPDTTSPDPVETEAAEAQTPEREGDDLDDQAGVGVEAPAAWTQESGAGEQLDNSASSEDEASSVNQIEDQLLAMVSQLVRPQAESGQAADTSVRVDLPPRADDYHLDPKEGREPLSPPSAESAEADNGPGGPLAELEALPDDEDLAQLRRLVLGREIDGLEAIHRHLNDPGRLAQTLSQVITEAIRLRVRQDNELIGVLKPTVDNIVRNSVRNNPSELADNLFPVMGPAIRRSISESIRGMLQNFSRTLEKSFSLTGLKWRLESMRTGLDFSEVVMLKTLEYQVEQVFAIHAESGTLILHLVNEGAKEEVKDPDQVAAMLTAIQQFVNDSFARGELSTLEFGDRNIYVARAPQVYVACVVLGQAPPNLRIDLQTALELLVMECADELDNFQNNTTHFNRARHHFEGLLVSRFKDEGEKLPFRAKFLTLALLVLLLAPFGVFGYKHYQMGEMEDRVRQNIDHPGLVLLQLDPSLFRRWEITCLKDDLAEFPEQTLAEAGLPRERYNIKYLPYISKDHEIVAKRIGLALGDKPGGVEEKFNPVNNSLILSGSASLSWVLMMYERLLAIPGLSRVHIKDLIDAQTGVVVDLDQDGIMHLRGQVSINWVLLMYEKLRSVSGLSGVDISGLSDPQNGVSAYLSDDGVLHLKGQASMGWLESVREQALRVPGISGVDRSELADDPASARIKELLAGINNTIIFFPLNKDQPVPEDVAKLDEVVEKLADLEKLADGMDMSVSLVIYGHADSSGSSKRNYDLSQERAKTLAAKLYAKQSNIPIYTYGLGADFALAAEGEAVNQRANADQASRKIELRVDLRRKGSSLDR